jgi:class 3 adenylate cyclase
LARQVQWTKSNGGNIAYEVSGAGVDVVEVPNGSALFWSEHPLSRAWPELVAEFARYTRYDMIGTGRSDPLPPNSPPTIDHQVADAVAVMDASGVEQAVVVGFFAAAAFALALAACHPDRVRGVIAVNGFARIVAADDFPIGVPSAVRERFEQEVGDEFGTGFMVRRWIPDVAHEPEMQAFMEQYEQVTSARGQITALSHLVTEVDVRDRLDQVRVPVTVIHARDNQVVPVALGRDLHERLPGSRYVEVPTSHHLFVLDPLLQVVLDETRAMATGERVQQGTASLAALMMADIVASTNRLSALRDQAWTALLAEYHERAHSTIARFHGRRVNTAGDGLLATFDSASGAVRCAAALGRAADEIGITVRSGVHVGDIEHHGNDVAGLAVHITARLLDHAPEGGVVVSDTAAQAAIGAGIPMTDLGDHTLRGVAGTWRLHRLEL